MNLRPHVLVLAIYLSTRGFAFVLFESPLSPIDWAVKDIRHTGKHDKSLLGIAELVDRYQPGVMVLQDTSARGTARVGRIRVLNSAIAELAENAGIETIAFSRGEVMRAFASGGATNKRELAEAIAAHIPAFERYLPPPRKPWMSEDSRMSLFDAAALALTFFQSPSGGAKQAA
jgi:hypothetical protein